MTPSPGCDARYEGGQKVCYRCGYRWDLDEEAPTCKTRSEIAKDRIDKIKKDLLI